MKVIRVLQLIDSLSVGGAEMLAVNLANVLNEQEPIDSYICATRNEGLLYHKIKDKSKYIFLNRKRTLDLRAVFNLRKFIKTNKIELLHAHSSSYFVAFCVKLTYPRLKILWHDHYGQSEYLSERKIQPLRFVSNFFSAVVVVNTNLLEWSRANLKVSNVSFLNNFVYLDNNDEVTNLKGVEGKRIVHLAALRPQKDHLNLLKAFYKLTEENSDWTLHLIGEGVNDDYEKSIHQFVKSKKLQENVFFYGACADVKFILKQADLGVLSSNSEGLPISLLEYAISGLPIISTNVGECKEIINKVNSSFLVAKSNSYALFKALENFIHLSDEEKRFYGLKFRTLIMKEYSHEKFVKQIIKIYRTC